MIIFGFAVRMRDRTSPKWRKICVDCYHRMDREVRLDQIEELLTDLINGTVGLTLGNEDNVERSHAKVATPLPVGCESAIDPRSGRRHFWRDVDPRGTTTWECPMTSVGNTSSRPVGDASQRPLHTSHVEVQGAQATSCNPVSTRAPGAKIEEYLLLDENNECQYMTAYHEGRVVKPKFAIRMKSRNATPRWRKVCDDCRRKKEGEGSLDQIMELIELHEV